jgi:hypothetical protein
MKKTIYICDGCGVQGDERTRTVRHRSSWGNGWTEKVQDIPEGWTKVTVNRKTVHVHTPECTTAAIQKAADEMVAKAQQKAKDAADKARKAADKARAKAAK